MQFSMLALGNIAYRTHQAQGAACCIALRDLTPRTDPQPLILEILEATFYLEVFGESLERFSQRSNHIRKIIGVNVFTQRTQVIHQGDLCSPQQLRPCCRVRKGSGGQVDIPNRKP